MKTLMAMIITLALGGCGALTTQEAAQYQEWKDSGELVKVKSPGGAFALGLLPGGGSLYTRRYALGILDILLWAPSILWDAPASYIAAQRINFDATQKAAKQQ